MRKKDKTHVFITGATGLMGGAALKELMKHPSEYEISVLARDSKKNRKLMKGLRSKGVKVIWGDLLDSEALMKGIKEADIVLHIGGMVSPAAEHYPSKTLEVNVGSAKKIASIIRELEEKDKFRTIKTVYIGSVSQYGSHNVPDHWKRVGDKLGCAKFDAYSLSKILAEREIVMAGLRKWVSIRQTAILHSGLLKKANDPVTFHVPLNGTIEWVTVEDSGRLIERICRRDVPDDFWNNYYNVGGGETFRLTNIEFERQILKSMGCPPPEKVFEPNWFATENFHGVWFSDSDNLDSILKFRDSGSFADSLQKMKEDLPFYFRFVPLVPAFVIKWFMKRVAKKKDLGPLSWIAENNTDRIDAAWGGPENYKKIGRWENYQELNLNRKKEINKSEAKNRKISNLLKEKRCSHGHSYLSSEILEYGGHGCPECLRNESFVDKVINQGCGQ
ncbi:MAG: NAD(P)-dependent oxidoreductase [Muribaculaceae bacterium]|nr:NAD(P)-dependent oxidoreductase [Muribaculaceae bacterium]